MSELYSTRPSTLLNLTEEYEAFCFDEACAYILMKMKNKETPHFRNNSKVQAKSYSKASDLYADLLGRRD